MGCRPSKRATSAREETINCKRTDRASPAGTRATRTEAAAERKLIAKNKRERKKGAKAHAKDMEEERLLEERNAREEALRQKGLDEVSQRKAAAAAAAAARAKAPR